MYAAACESRASGSPRQAPSLSSTAGAINSTARSSGFGAIKYM
jgi:hypothetical protein